MLSSLLLPSPTECPVRGLPGVHTQNKLICFHHLCCCQAVLNSLCMHAVE